MSKVLYHYTSEKGYKGILEEQLINPSLRANNPKDARYGDGQYVSDIIPSTKRPGPLSMIFFGIPWAGKRFTHNINIDISGLDLVYGRTHVILIKNSEPLDISNRLVGHGRNS